MAADAELSDLEFAALISSRICHDVISPVGAIANGLEVLAEESDEAMREHAFDLIRQSEPADDRRTRQDQNIHVMVTQMEGNSHGPTDVSKAIRIMGIHQDVIRGFHASTHFRVNRRVFLTLWSSYSGEMMDKFQFAEK